ncbi:MAG: IS21 family transposase [Phycisphaerales bacterium JB038]
MTSATGSLRAVQRYWGQAFPAPKRRARRRVETPAGAQAQVDWGEYRDVWIGGAKTTLYALHIQLSYSRFGAVVWSRRKNQIAWQGAHNEALRRLGGVPATLRVDNEKTAMARGAGAHGTINMQYRRYAQVVRFHIDACAPRAPEHKGKVERRICDQRFRDDPRKRHWNDLRELQAWTDHRVELSAKRRRCPATGTPVIEAWEQERPLLQPLPILPEPFDVAVRRPVGIDCMVNFEGRQYSVPFALCGRSVEVRGCVDEVQVLTPSAVVARHPRGTKERIVIDPAHFEGEATQDMLPPLPLGRMGRKLAEIAALELERRPIDLYAALAEVAR